MRTFARDRIAGAVLLALVLSSAVAAAPSTFTFTSPNPGWVAMRLGGAPHTDVEGDATGPRDVVGDSANPAVYVASDATHLYFRLRVDTNPLQSTTNFTPFAWGCLVGTDTDPTTYEFSGIVDGVTNPDGINFFKNTVTTVPNSPNESPDLPALSVVTNPLSATVLHAEVVSAPSNFGGDPDFFVDWALELSTVTAAGFNPANATRYYCASSSSPSILDADCLGSAATGCPLDTQFSDPVRCGTGGCAICGDGTVGPAEGCDDGNLVSGDGCSAACVRENGRPCTLSSQCGSGFCDPAGNTCACDQDTDCAPGQVCKTVANPNVCATAGCGNGVLEAGEGCDDNNLNAGDGCSPSCKLELGQPCINPSHCASGFCDAAGNVCACDGNVDCPGTQVCKTSANPNACVAPGCGNDVLETNEGCDDGNTTAGDGCNASCQLELGRPCTLAAQCASGFCDSANNSCACDQDLDCPSSQLCRTSSDPNSCVAPGCGNGVLEATEGCDDGNTAPGDGCDGSCKRELGQGCTLPAECASAFCDSANSTCACDGDSDCPGSDVCKTSSNPNVCVAAGCGNGVLEPGEGCDDGNTAPDDGCNGSCKRELGQTCAGATECASAFCDSANTCRCDDVTDCATGMLCRTTPQPNSCVAPGCGNGVAEPNEGCDDGNLNGGDGCNASCFVELGTSCDAGVQCASGFCDSADDACACDQSSDCPAGQLCRANVDPNACVAPGCGNGVVEASEACDDGNVASGDGCGIGCLRELGASCTAGTECESSYCDGANVCALQPVDAGVDGGEADAGEVDAGVIADAGSSGGEDAGVVADAGSSSGEDAGTSGGEEPPSGCGCEAFPGGAALWLIAFALFTAARRNRATESR